LEYLPPAGKLLFGTWVWKTNAGPGIGLLSEGTGIENGTLLNMSVLHAKIVGYFIPLLQRNRQAFSVTLSDY
jgi:hypothetical protein